ncbi:hypothetical protein, partial [Enterococcus faecalis]|uniref:hypothetical protein n=1 Tax=Enterococcus faecalis TaxID=1351 RepID=UPI00403F3311
ILFFGLFFIAKITYSQSLCNCNQKPSMILIDASNREAAFNLYKKDHMPIGVAKEFEFEKNIFIDIVNFVEKSKGATGLRFYFGEMKNQPG